MDEVLTASAPMRALLRSTAPRQRQHMHPRAPSPDRRPRRRPFPPTTDHHHHPPPPPVHKQNPNWNHTPTTSGWLSETETSCGSYGGAGGARGMASDWRTRWCPNPCGYVTHVPASHVRGTALERSPHAATSRTSRMCLRWRGRVESSRSTNDANSAKSGTSRSTDLPCVPVARIRHYRRHHHHRHRHHRNHHHHEQFCWFTAR